MWFNPPHPHSHRWNAPAGRLSTCLGFVLRAGDPLLLVLSALLAHRWLHGSYALSVEHWRHVTLTLLLALLVLGASSLYGSWRGRRLTAECTQLTAKWLLVFACLSVYALLIGAMTPALQRWLIAWAATGLAAVLMLRLVVRHGARWVRRQGLDQRTAVVIGGTAEASQVIEALRQNTWAGITVSGWFSTRVDTCAIHAAPALGGLEGLQRYLDGHAVDQVWIALPMHAKAQIEATLAQLEHTTADIKFVPDRLSIPRLNQSVEQVAGLAVINLQQTPLQGDSRLLKALEDRLLASAILLLVSPLMLLIAAAVKLSSPGPVFYRQQRMSWNNKTFWMLKFRSMPVDAEQSSGAVWARSGESRATRVGSFLRRTSLDELPQFINVLRGDMSIVGPRPERPVFVERFKHEIPAYMKKHMVKAGITGWAQVNGWRGSTDLAKRIECDLYYITHWSLWFDLKIIVATLFKGFVHKNAY